MASSDRREARQEAVEDADKDIDIVRDYTGPSSGSGDATYETHDASADRAAGGTAPNGDALKPSPAAGKRELFRRASELRPRDHANWPIMFAGEYPTLAEWLARGSWDGLQPRDAGKLSIAFKGGLVIGTLALPTESQTITLHAESVSSLFLSLDEACATGKGPWVDMKWGTGVQKKRDARKKEVDKLRDSVSTDPLGGGEPR